MKILQKLEKLKNTPSDINEHLQNLMQYGQQVNHITEFGTRSVVSAYSFLAANPKKLICYDIHRHNNIEEAIQLAQEKNIDFTFIEADVLKIEIEQTDLLFIDTLHIYTQLKKELALHASKVNKYIILHDVVTFGNKEENIEYQTETILKNYITGEKKGLMPAIEEFLKENSNWMIEKVYTNNNGLMILKRLN